MALTFALAVLQSWNATVQRKKHHRTFGMFLWGMGQVCDSSLRFSTQRRIMHFYRAVLHESNKCLLLVDEDLHAIRIFI